MNPADSSRGWLPHGASFRDPSGFIFICNGTVYRQVNVIYGPHYDHLMDSGLYRLLTQNRWLIEHSEVDFSTGAGDAYKILQPERIPFISHPYEWSFSQLKDAALRTLDIQESGLQYGMTLKDASAYNIQFAQGAPVFLDTLSFERYEEGQPWVAYRQYCQHFLAPLALMAKTDVRLNQLLRVYVDGIPLEMASRLLPKTSRFNPGLAIHLHLHARMQQAFSKTDKPARAGKSRTSRLSKTGLIGILKSLRKTVRKLEWNPGGTEWAEYYRETNYSESSFEGKVRIVRNYLQSVNARLVWDLGANTGRFSRLAEELGAVTIAFDADPAAVDIHYRSLRERGASSILPLVLDLTNPSPSLGWHHKERESLLERGPADCILALALIHHLAISNNVPLDRIADFFADLGRHLIIEFVPKSDSQVQRLLQSRKDIFDAYAQEYFEKAFSKRFTIIRVDQIEGSERTLYLMERKHQSAP